MPDTRLNGRVALVTGASRGFGRSIALTLGKAGADLVITSRTKDALRGVSEEADALGIKVLSSGADVRSTGEIHALREAVEKEYGHLDILVNNAGVNIRRQLVDFTLDEWRTVIDTNLTGAFLMCHEFLPLMTNRGYGRIINLTSTMSHIALPGRTAYAASKSGLLGFTKALALELASEGVTVNGISPGPFATEMNRVFVENPVESAKMLSMIPLGRWGDPKDIGYLALYLCSEEASYITGTDILIDGGWVAH